MSSWGDLSFCRYQLCLIAGIVLLMSHSLHALPGNSIGLRANVVVILSDSPLLAINLVLHSQRLASLIAQNNQHAGSSFILYNSDEVLFIGYG